jgi:glycosyltransferase involved in cell wall biosynthesis
MSDQNPKPTVSFVVPALNEEGNIEAAVKNILQAGEHSCRDFEIILVNDGSTDRTGAIMDELAARHKTVRVVHNKHNSGYGGAFKKGAAVAQKEFVVRVCGDDVSPAECLKKILSQAGKADLVLPYLINPEIRPWGRRFGSWGFTTLINMLFGQRVRYYNHCVVFRRDNLEAITIRTNGFVYQAEAVVKLLKAGCSYVEVSTYDVPRLHGYSSALRPKNLFICFRAVYELMWEVRRPGSIPNFSAKPPVSAPIKQEI